MIRHLSAIAAGLLCALYGFHTAAQLQHSAANLRRWADILAHLSLLIAEATLPLPQVLRLAASDTGVPDRLLQSIAQAMVDDPLASPAETFAARGPPCAERDTLLRMFTRLSRGDAAQRALAAEQAGREMEALAGHAARRAATDVKLYRTLGLTGGACLTLLLL